MKTSFRMVAAASALSFASGCSLGEDDVRKALKWSAQMNAGNLADMACGFSTFGLEAVQVTNLSIDGNGSGSATVGGAARDGSKKGQACSGDVKFTYGKGRAVTHGVNGQSTSFVAVITSVKRAH